jgi:integrase
MARKTRNLTDPQIEALREFSVLGDHWDGQVPGLVCRVGIRKTSWFFFRQKREHGTRRAVYVTLGEFPTMGVAAAREDATVHAADVIRGTAKLGKREAINFGEALDKYLDYLRRQSERRGKPPRWANNVERYAKTLLRPQWEKWPLADMAANPAAVADWHRKITETAGPVSANRCCQVIRAMYKRAARGDLSLLKHNDPCAAVEFNSETPAQKGLAFKDFPKWKTALDKIGSPIYRAYHLCGLLTGARPGELARLRWEDVKPRERLIVIGKAKAGADIAIPMSSAIARTLKLARDAESTTGRRTVREDFVFPGAAQKGHRDRLPARGNELRHTYRTVCADLGIDDLLSHFLMGHAPAGISQGYVVRLLLTSGPAMRQAQRKISRRVMSLLKI